MYPWHVSSIVSLGGHCWKTVLAFGLILVKISIHPWWKHSEPILHVSVWSGVGPLVQSKCRQHPLLESFGSSFILLYDEGTTIQSPSRCLCYPQIAPKLFFRLSSNSVSVLLMTRGCARRLTLIKLCPFYFKEFSLLRPAFWAKQRTTSIDLYHLHSTPLHHIQKERGPKQSPLSLPLDSF